MDVGTGDVVWPVAAPDPDAASVVVLSLPLSEESDEEELCNCCVLRAAEAVDDAWAPVASCRFSALPSRDLGLALRGEEEADVALAAPGDDAASLPSSAASGDPFGRSALGPKERASGTAALSKAVAATVVLFSRGFGGEAGVSTTFVAAGISSEAV